MTLVRNRRRRLSGSELLHIKRILLVGALSVLLSLAGCGTQRRILTTSTVPPASTTGQPRKYTTPAEKRAAGDTRLAGVKTISLMLPLRLTQMPSKSRVEIERSSLSLDFYQGFRMALDSLTAGTPGLALNVLDTRDDSVRVAQILSEKTLIGSKLIVGPVYPSELHKVTDYAVQTHTWFVSPLAPQPLSVYHNPYLIAANCSLDLYATRTADYIKQNYPDAKMLFIHNAEAEVKFLTPLKAELGLAGKDVYLAKAGRFDALRQSLSTEKPNILIVPSLDAAFWSRLMVFLSSLSDIKLIVFAHPGFERMHFSNNQLLQALDLHFASNYFVDKNSAAVQDFVRKYKSTWASLPDEYAYRGFDLGMYFGHIILHGEDIEKALGASYTGLAGSMSFKAEPGMGYSNEAISILSYESGALAQVK